jgi:hypothetical protein
VPLQARKMRTISQPFIKARNGFITYLAFRRRVVSRLQIRTG